MLLYQPGETNPNLPRVNWEGQTLIMRSLIICSSEKTTLQSSLEENYSFGWCLPGCASHALSGC